MSDEYTPTGADLAAARARLAVHLDRFAGHREYAMRADIFTLITVRGELERGDNGAAPRIRQALALLVARDELDR